MLHTHTHMATHTGIHMTIVSKLVAGHQQQILLLKRRISQIQVQNAKNLFLNRNGKMKQLNGWN